MTIKASRTFDVHSEEFQNRIRNLKSIRILKTVFFKNLSKNETENFDYFAVILRLFSNRKLQISLGNHLLDTGFARCCIILLF